MAKKVKVKKPKKPFITKFKTLAIVGIMCYAVYTLISQQVALSDKKAENAAIKEKITIAQQTNDEYQSLVNMADEDEYIKRNAIENYGYAFPGEIRIYDKN